MIFVFFDEFLGLLEGNAVVGLVYQHQPNQLLQQWMNLLLDLQLSLHYFLHYSLVRLVLLRHLEGQLPGAQLVKRHSHAPDITLADVLHLRQGARLEP